MLQYYKVCKIKNRHKLKPDITETRIALSVVSVRRILSFQKCCKFENWHTHRSSHRSRRQWPRDLLHQPILWWYLNFLLFSPLFVYTFLYLVSIYIIFLSHLFYFFSFIFLFFFCLLLSCVFVLNFVIYQYQLLSLCALLNK